MLHASGVLHSNSQHSAARFKEEAGSLCAADDEGPEEVEKLLGVVSPCQVGHANTEAVADGDGDEKQCCVSSSTFAGGDALEPLANFRDLYYRSDKATSLKKIQNWDKLVEAEAQATTRRELAEGEELERYHAAATVIQKYYRSFKARQYALQLTLQLKDAAEQETLRKQQQLLKQCAQAKRLLKQQAKDLLLALYAQGQYSRTRDRLCQAKGITSQSSSQDCPAIDHQLWESVQQLGLDPLLVLASAGLSSKQIQMVLEASKILNPRVSCETNTTSAASAHAEAGDQGGSDDADVGWAVDVLATPDARQGYVRKAPTQSSPGHWAVLQSTQQQQEGCSNIRFSSDAGTGAFMESLRVKTKLAHSTSFGTERVSAPFGVKRVEELIIDSPKSGGGRPLSPRSAGLDFQRVISPAHSPMFSRSSSSNARRYSMCDAIALEGICMGESGSTASTHVNSGSLALEVVWAKRHASNSGSSGYLSVGRPPLPPASTPAHTVVRQGTAKLPSPGGASGLLSPRDSLMPKSQQVAIGRSPTKATGTVLDRVSQFASHSKEASGPEGAGSSGMPAQLALATYSQQQAHQVSLGRSASTNLGAHAAASPTSPQPPSTARPSAIAGQSQRLSRTLSTPSGPSKISDPGSSVAYGASQLDGDQTRVSDIPSLLQNLRASHSPRTLVAQVSFGMHSGPLIGASRSRFRSHSGAEYQLFSADGTMRGEREVTEELPVAFQKYLAKAACRSSRPETANEECAVAPRREEPRVRRKSHGALSVMSQGFW